MKYYHIKLILLLLLPLILSCKNLKCCKNKNDVKNALNGFWKQKDIDSNEINRYLFDSKYEYGILYQSQYTDEKKLSIDGPTYISHTNIIVKKSFGFFKLKFVSLSGQVIFKIKYLDEQKLILKTKGKEIEYKKIIE